jgi:hypothetical protein
VGQVDGEEEKYKFIFEEGESSRTMRKYAHLGSGEILQYNRDFCIGELELPNLGKIKRVQK